MQPSTPGARARTRATTRTSARTTTSARTRTSVAFASVALLASFVLGCHAPMPMPELSPRASAVGVDKAPPPPHARALGEVLGEHGAGCGLSGQKGTYEGAEAVLRERTAAMGGDYAQIVSVEPPVHTMDCLANRWVIHAMAYKTAFAGTVASPAVAGTAAPPPAAAPPAPSCDPPCSPGYACSAGTCLALCNPTCGPGQVCRQDRTCGSAN